MSVGTWDGWSCFVCREEAENKQEIERQLAIKTSPQWPTLSSSINWNQAFKYMSLWNFTFKPQHWNTELKNVKHSRQYFPLFGTGSRTVDLKSDTIIINLLAFSSPKYVIGSVWVWAVDSISLKSCLCPSITVWSRKYNFDSLETQFLFTEIRTVITTQKLEWSTPCPEHWHLKYSYQLLQNL